MSRRVRTRTIEALLSFKRGDVWSLRSMRFTRTYQVEFIGAGAPVLFVSESGEKTWVGTSPSRHREQESTS